VKNNQTPQKTINYEVFLEGVGVHSGERSAITLRPAQENSGITLLNKKFPNDLLQIGTVVPEQAMHATVLKAKTWAVSTVEHLMAAIHGLEIDNLLVEIEGFELPILDGSALPFVQAIQATGLKIQIEPKQFVTPKQTLRFEEQKKYIEIQPANKDNTLYFDYSVNFEHPLVRDSRMSGSLSPTYFTREIAPARTFGFLEQLPLLRKHGLAKGTTLGNTVVVGQEIVLNSQRFEDEFIRHKLLDLIGDLTLLGKPLAGTIIAHKTGHSFTRKIIEHSIQHPDQWEAFTSK